MSTIFRGATNVTTQFPHIEGAGAPVPLPTLEEVKDALKTFRNNKVPVVEATLAELLKTMSVQMATKLHEV